MSDDDDSTQKRIRACFTASSGVKRDDGVLRSLVKNRTKVDEEVEKFNKTNFCSILERELWGKLDMTN